MTPEQRIDLAVGLASALPDNVMAWINRRSAEQREAALEELATVNPSATAEILRLQGQVKAIDTAMEWLATIVNDARAAQAELERASYDD